MSDSEKLFDFFFVDPGTDNADLAGNIGRTNADFRFTRNVIEVEPVTVFSCNDSLGTEDRAVVYAVIKSCEDVFEPFLAEGTGCLISDAVEDFVCVMVFVIMIVAAACAFFTVLMMVMMLMFLIMIVMVAALVIFVVVVVMAALMVIIVIMVVMVMLMLFSFCQSLSHVSCRYGFFDRLEDLDSGELVPGCRYDL